MIKKLLSLILSLALIVSILPAALAAETETEGSLEFLPALQLTNETAAPDKLLTRLELAEIYYKIVTKATEVYPADYASEYFTDINEEMATAVDFVYRLGLMNGIGGGLFDPDGNLTYAQLLKTIVSFLGYDVMAQAKGGYPNGYVLVASELDIGDGLDFGSETPVSWGIAESVFLNAANADIAVYLNDDFTVQRGKNYLYQFRDIKMASGIVTADTFSDYENDKSRYYGFVKLDGIEFAVLEGAKNILDKAGMEVNVMYTDGERIPEIVYFQLLDGKKTLILGTDIDEVSSNTISYYQGDKIKKLRYNNNTKIMYNGIAPESYSLPDILNPFDEKDGSLTCIDSDGNGVADVIYVSAYNVMVVGNVKDGVAYNKYGTSPIKKIDLNELNEGSLINIMGIPVNPSDVAKNDILTYESSIIDGKEICTKVTVTVDRGGGIVEEMSYDGTHIEKVKISGIEYVFSKSVRSNPDYIDRDSKLRIGVNLVLYFGTDTNVADFEIVEDTGFSVGLIADYGETDGIDSKKSVKIFNSAGNFEIFELNDKITVHYVDNGADKHELIKAEELVDILGRSSYKSGDIDNTDKLERQVIKYKTNADGKLSELVKAGIEGLYFVNDKHTGTVSDYTKLANLYYKKSLGNFDLQSYVGSSTKIFQIPDESDRGNDSAYALTNISSFNNGQYRLIGYTSDEASPYMNYAIYVKGAAQSTAYHALNCMIVEKVTQIKDEEGMAVSKYSGYIYTDGATALKSGEITLADDVWMNTDGEKVEAGDIIGYALNPSNKVSTVYQYVDYSKNDFGSGQNKTEGTSNAYYGKLPNPYFAHDSGPMFAVNGTSTINGFIGRFWGRVVEKTNSHVKIECVDTMGYYKGHAGEPAGEKTIPWTGYFPIERFNSTVTVNERTGEVKCGAFDNAKIYDEETYGDEASYVFVFTQGEYWRFGAVYNK